MGILKRCEIIEIISEIRNINQENVVLYNENEYDLPELLKREKTSIFIQKWLKNKINNIPQNLDKWICWGCEENRLNCECFS